MKFVPSTSLWSELYNLKLNVLKLSEEATEITGYYKESQHTNAPTYLNVAPNGHSVPKGFVRVKGSLILYNTIENLKAAVGNNIIEYYGCQMLQNIFTLKHNTDFSVNYLANSLHHFILLAYIDHKDYVCHFWFANTTLELESRQYELDNLKKIEHAYGKAQSTKIVTCIHNFLKEQEQLDFSYIVDIKSDQVSPVTSLIIIIGLNSNFKSESTTLQNLIYAIWSLTSWDKANFILWETNKGFADKNRVHTLTVLRHSDESKATLMGFQPLMPFYNFLEEKPSIEDFATELNLPTCKYSNLGPNRQFELRQVQLKPFIDPDYAVSMAANLNLKLMTWRSAPDLDIEKIEDTKCLLIGAGMLKKLLTPDLDLRTLGCVVMRCLVSWGVTDIAVIDNAFVSPSNPTRQSLYELSDCTLEGRPKVEVAAEKLKKINSQVNVKGIHMSVPMPGRILEADDLIQKEVETLRKLVEEHDVIYLLTDSREARWLPAFFGSLYNKLVITAALDFDSYLVMRHGVRSSNATIPHLSCYFCNDFIPPSNSSINLAMDRRCTVTRPGLAGIAGSLAVELMVSIMQHDDGAEASACVNSITSYDSNFEKGKLGYCPHIIRGQLHKFEQRQFVGSLDGVGENHRCFACSEMVHIAYKVGSSSWITDIMKDPKLLEAVTGVDRHLGENIVNFTDEDTDDDYFESIFS